MFLCISLLVLSVLQLSGAMESGIVGGKAAKAHSRPYMVSLQHDKDHICGGMLIKNDYVLTSAHCLDHYDSSEEKRLSVVLGAHNISEKEPSQQRLQVRKFFKHPFYEEGKRNYDIVLLKLKTKAKLNEFVEVIALPKKDKKIPALKMCSIAGWGRKVQNGNAARVLQEVTLKLQFNFECKYLWQQYFDSRTMICTASDGKRAFCQGDSGSPLICNSKPQGIAAYTHPEDCTNRKYPEVYIKIAHFYPWINKTISSN